MKYYVLNPDTNEKELVGEAICKTMLMTNPPKEGPVVWNWAVDPRAVREDELVCDENGKCFNLKELVNEDS